MYFVHVIYWNLLNPNFIVLKLLTKIKTNSFLLKMKYRKSQWSVDTHLLSKVLVKGNKFTCALCKFEKHFKLYLVAISFHSCNFFVYFQVLQPPAGYIPIRTPARRLLATPTPIAGTPTGFRIQTPDSKVQMVDMQPKGNLPMMKPDDMQYFDKLLVSFTSYLKLFYTVSFSVFHIFIDLIFTTKITNASNSLEQCKIPITETGKIGTPNTAHFLELVQTLQWKVAELSFV